MSCRNEQEWVYEHQESTLEYVRIGAVNEQLNGLTGEFIDAVVWDQQRAAVLLADHPNLLNARWLWGETVLHFLAVEAFANGVKFLAEHGADVNAVDSSGEPPLISVVVLGHVEIA